MTRTEAAPGEDAPVRRIAATAIDAPPCALGESPRWAHGAWWWVDAEAGTVWTAGTGLTSAGSAGEARAVIATGGRVSLVHPAGDGRLVVASGLDLVVLDPHAATWVRWSRVDLPDGWLLNDGTADDAGRLWIGSVHPERRRGAGSLYVVETDGRVREAASGITLSNGMAWWSPGVLVHADSLERCLWEHTTVPGSGRVMRSRRAITLPQGHGPLALPDGVALDDAGGLWVAMYGAGQVWRLVDGRVESVVDVPTPQVTSVALGGPDGRDLLVTTAREGLDPVAIEADPFAGRLFHARAEVGGRTVPPLRPRAVDS